MAGDWIKVEITTPDKPEVVRLADRLGIDQDAVAGKLVRFWIWADQQSVDGDSLGVTSAFIDRLTNCPGFSAGLLEVGWLTSRNGRLSVPHFDRHNGQTAKSRALTKDRVKRSRNAPDVTPALPESEKSEIREEKKEGSKPPGKATHNVPGGPAPAAVLVFPVVGDTTEWGLEESKLAEYRESFPDLDVLAECRKARQWCLDNKTNRKTAGGMPKFLGSWLSRAQNSGVARGHAKPTRRTVQVYDPSSFRPDSGGA
jgi:hypothetical protein